MSKEIGQRLKECRIKLGLSQTDMGKAMEVPQTTWSNYENGTNKFKVDLVELFCKVFEVRVEWLMMGNGPMFVADEQSVYDEIKALREENAELKKQLTHVDGSTKAYALADANTQPTKVQEESPPYPDEERSKDEHSAPDDALRE